MTDDTHSPAVECRHNLITTFREIMGGPGRMWACSDCQRRFYPACPTCIDVAHRNEAHPKKARATSLDVERLAQALSTPAVRRYVTEAWVDGGVSEPGYATVDEMAEVIAREYAALAILEER
jgi:hypothetical protein